MKKIKIVTAIILVSAAALFYGCNEWTTYTERPILLVEAGDWDGDGSPIGNLRIEDSEGTIHTIYSGILELQPADSTGENNSQGYTYLLEEGKSYNKIYWDRDGVEQEITITIESAEPGVIYHARIG